MKKLVLLMALCCSFNLLAIESNGIVYVVSGGTGDKSGSSWTNAKDSIQTAIDLARADLKAVKDVWVAGGTYKITKSIAPKDSVNLIGGFSGTETAKADRPKVKDGKAWEFVNPTIIDAGKTITCINIKAPAAKDAVNEIDGFTLINGKGENGGGMHLRTGYIFRNAIVTDCEVTANGGGVCLSDGGSMFNTYLHNNKASLGGGFYANAAADSEINVADCLVESNEVYGEGRANRVGNGGGCRIQGSGTTGTVNINNTVFMNNKATFIKEATTVIIPNTGGAIYTAGTQHRVTNCLIANNSGANAIYAQCEFRNVTLANNVGGIYNAKAGAKYYNMIIFGSVTAANENTGITGNFKSEFKNCVLYNNPPAAFDTTKILFFPSNKSNGDVLNAPVGKLASGPKFKQPSRFKGVATNPQQLDSLRNIVDFSLNATSPLRDKGDNAFALPTQKTDLAGNLRIANKIEMGAYEISRFNVSVKIDGVDMGTVQGAGKYSWGEKATLQALPAAGHKFDFWSLNAEPLLDLPATFTITVEDDVEYEAFFSKGGSINQISTGARLYTTNNILYIDGAFVAVSIFTADGTQVATSARADNHKIVLEKGVYIVKLCGDKGMESRKVIL